MNYTPLVDICAMVMLAGMNEVWYGHPTIMNGMPLGDHFVYELLPMD
jgi:hypothetical protein